jgi:hypothetical protein
MQVTKHLQNLCLTHIKNYTIERNESMRFESISQPIVHFYLSY